MNINPIRLIGKVNFFGLIGPKKSAEIAIFVQGGIQKPSPFCRVEATSNVILITCVCVIVHIAISYPKVQTTSFPPNLTYSLF